MTSFLRPIRCLRLSWLLVLLGLVSGGSWAQNDVAQPPLVQAQEIRSQLKKLTGQLARLRQASAQSDHQLSVQVQGVHRQIEHLERSQAELIERLQTLQTQHAQYQADHRQHSQQLRHVLSGLAALGGLILLVLWRLRAPRAARPEPQPRASTESSTPRPTDPQPKAPSAAALPNAAERPEVPQPLSPPTLDVAADAFVNAAPLVAPSLVSLSSPFLTAPADLAAPVTDSSSTEQVLAQGLQGFMQPVPFK